MRSGTWSSTAWVMAKWTLLAAFLALIVTLFSAPRGGLLVLWYVAVPLLPALFLINAEIWRNVCPLATLNTLVRDEDGRPLGPRASRIAAVVGVAVLLVAIPLRVALLNESGFATGVLLAAMGIFALVSGIPFQRKAGFCNSVCPVLPVERLYGQAPLLGVRNVRCTPCQACTRAACYDLNPGRSALQIMGAGAAERHWTLLPFGVFALAFPGVIVGYSLATLGGAGVGAVAVGGGLSWLVLTSVFVLRRVTPASGLLAAAVLSAATFYWFTPAAVSEGLGLPGAATALMRGVALGLVGFWAIRAARSERARRRVVTLTRSASRVRSSEPTDA